MDTRQLALFLTLADNLHFGETAEALHLSASAVSRAVKRIETEIGQTLLERDNRSVRLTDVGRQFEAYARNALEQWQAFNDTISQTAAGLSGEVSVFCSVTAAYSVLSSVLELFRRSHPGIEIKLHTGDQADAIDHLIDGDDDIAIAARPDKLSSRVHFQTLSYSPLFFIYPAARCAVHSAVEALSSAGKTPDWEKIPFILSERGLARARLEQWFRAHNIKPDIYARVSGHEAIVSMVSLGFGIGVVPELVLTNSPLKDKVRVLDVQPALAPFAVGLCALNQRLHNPLVNAFWECARTSYRKAF